MDLGSISKDKWVRKLMFSILLFTNNTFANYGGLVAGWRG